jgi:hypothetical protein
MPTEDSAIQNALDDYNNRLAKSHNRIRRFSGRVMWVGAALSWGLAILAAFLVFKEPAVAADLDGGTRTRNVAWDGRAAAAEPIPYAMVRARDPAAGRSSVAVDRLFRVPRIAVTTRK